MGNLGYLFYKNYYSLDTKEINEFLKKSKIDCNKMYDTKLKKMNEKIIGFKLNKKKENSDFFKYFELKTTYPGLLIGSGYVHETGSEDEFKLGFQFDYTTGLPIIPGSSIKGVLKNAFEHEAYIKELLGLKEYTKEDIKKIKKNIFEGYEYNEGNEKLLSIYKRDIFCDSTILYKIEESEKREKGIILNDDYVTPHGIDPLKNPVPIKFLKVVPNVVFGFKFLLNDFEYGKVKITADMKEKLFKTIILDLGLGAKTNIGYGQFKDI